MRARPDCSTCSGKTTLLNVMAMGTAVETVPTIGLNVKMVKRGGVNMKCWDIGGQKQYSECCTAVAPCAQFSHRSVCKQEASGADILGDAAVSFLLWTRTRCVAVPRAVRILLAHTLASCSATKSHKHGRNCTGSLKIGTTCTPAFHVSSWTCAHMQPCACVVVILLVAAGSLQPHLCLCVPTRLTSHLTYLRTNSSAVRL